MIDENKSQISGKFQQGFVYKNTTSSSLVSLGISIKNTQISIEETKLPSTWNKAMFMMQKLTYSINGEIDGSYHSSDCTGLFVCIVSIFSNVHFQLLTKKSQIGQKVSSKK